MSKKYKRLTKQYDKIAPGKATSASMLELAQELVAYVDKNNNYIQKRYKTVVSIDNQAVNYAVKVLFLVRQIISFDDKADKQAECRLCHTYIDTMLDLYRIMFEHDIVKDRHFNPVLSRATKLSDLCIGLAMYHQRAERTSQNINDSKNTSLDSESIEGKDAKEKPYQVK